MNAAIFLQGRLFSSLKSINIIKISYIPNIESISNFRGFENFEMGLNSYHDVKPDSITVHLFPLPSRERLGNEI